MASSARSEFTVADESLGESVNKEVFSTYVCRSVQRGKPHPGDIAEPSSLSAISLPPCSYPLWDSLPDHVVETGKLSQLQLEGILHACNKFQEMLPSGERAGFFIGDGAGVGKGRQIAGVILDSYARGRRQHIWLSTSSDLQLDAQRDLADLGCHIKVINNCQTLDREQKALGLSKDYQEGVLFLTYSTIISQARGKSRLEQVIDWVGGPSFQGCLVFDECHKAKNFVPGKEAQSTKVSAAVIELQQRLPLARVLYCSATGVSEVGNMAYMTRMGLWGPATAFQGFQEFLDTMKKRGVSFMEMLAMEMKAEGKYVARGLSFKDAEFMELEAVLTTEQIEMYDAAVAVWQSLRLKLELALEMCGIPRGDVQKVFWSSQQRFFKLLCVSLKVPLVVEEANAALAAGHSVVIGLQSTGESAIEAMGLEPGPLPNFMSATKELLARLILTHFPVKPPMLEGAPENLQPKEIPACVQMKAEMLQAVDSLQLPPNFLDQLVDLLGGPSNVAEMTGRRGRIIKDARGRHFFELRAKPDSNDMDSLNVREKDAFMKGQKLVAIISDAASTGISLHASRTAPNQRRRVHLTIELPWSADKAIQQLGRSHRSNQVTGPIYKLVSTQVGGEKRFASAVARRLQSLGALTRGDRRAASGIDLSEQNFDTPLGRKSLRRMYNHVVLESPHLPSGMTLTDVYKDSDAKAQAEAAALTDPVFIMEHVKQMHSSMRSCCDMMGIGLSVPRNDTVVEDKLKEPTKEVGDVRRFLNRILGLPIARQNVLFNYFAATLAAEIRAAKAEGRFSEGVGDLPGSNITPAGPPKTLWVDPHNSAMKATQHQFIIDRGITFEEAVRRLEREAVPGDESGFRRSKRPLFNRHLVILALQKPGRNSVFTMVRPNTGDSYFDMERSELDQKYHKVTAEDVREEWREMYEQTLHTCMHGRACQQGPGCQVGKRQLEVTILAGSVVLVWGVLETVLERNERSLSKAERMLRVVRVPLHAERYLIGVRYPATLVPEVVVMLQSMQLMTIAGGVLQASSRQQGQTTKEPPTPVCPKSLARAFRPPVTLMNFFKRKVTEASSNAMPSSTSLPVTTPSTDPPAPIGSKRPSPPPFSQKRSNPTALSHTRSEPVPPSQKRSATASLSQKRPDSASFRQSAAGSNGKAGQGGHNITRSTDGVAPSVRGGLAGSASQTAGFKRTREVEVLVIEDSLEEICPEEAGDVIGAGESKRRCAEGVESGAPHLSPPAHPARAPTSLSLSPGATPPPDAPSSPRSSTPLSLPPCSHQQLTTESLPSGKTSVQNGREAGPIAPGSGREAVDSESGRESKKQRASRELDASGRESGERQGCEALGDVRQGNSELGSKQSAVPHGIEDIGRRSNVADMPMHASGVSRNEALADENRGMDSGRCGAVGGWIGTCASRHETMDGRNRTVGSNRNGVVASTNGTVGTSGNGTIDALHRTLPSKNETAGNSGHGALPGTDEIAGTSAHCPNDGRNGTLAQAVTNHADKGTANASNASYNANKGGCHPNKVIANAIKGTASVVTCDEHSSRNGASVGAVSGMGSQEDGLAVLVNMGFTAKQAGKALLVSRSNVQQAIELLLAGMA